MTEETIQKLRRLRMSAMADAYLAQINEPDNFRGMTFDERFAMLVDRECDVRYNNKLKRMIKNARFPSDHAFISDIAYLPGRNLDKDLIMRLATCNYIAEKRNIIIVGPTGVGKTFLANCLGLLACQNGFRARYVRLPDLFTEFGIAIESRRDTARLLKEYQKYDLLILDEYLLSEPRPEDTQIMFEISERRYDRGATIFCSQFDPSAWHVQLGGGPMVEAMLDRITSNAYTMVLTGESMRRYKAEA